jgi:tetratricopeptide (TPR) repeat protein
MAEDKERDRKIVEVVKLLLRSAVLYRQLCDEYHRGTIRFEEIQKLVDDKGQSLLFNLKKVCHDLFRGNHFGSDKEQLLDLAVSSLFHEAMIIRENCYQVETYGPKAKTLEEKTQKGPHEKKFLKELNRTLERANKRLSVELKEINALLSETLEQLKDLIISYPENGLLLRFLLENEPLVKEVYGSEGLENILSTMYKEGRLAALRVAASSYYNSGYFQRASESIQKALALTPSSEIRFFYFFYTGLKDYYEDNYQGALENFQAAKELEASLSVSHPEYAKRMETLTKVIQGMAQEANKNLLGVG